MTITNKNPIYFSLVISIFSIVLSIIALCSISEHTFYTDSTLVSIVAIIVTISVGLVTILIGWQIYNYFNLEQRIKEITNTSISSFIDDFNKYNIAISASNNDVEYVVESMKCKSIKAYVEGFKNAIMCENPLMRKSAINYIMNRVQTNHDSDIKQTPDKWFIPKGKKNEYLRVLKRIDHDNIDILIEYVQRAMEIDKQ